MADLPTNQRLIAELLLAHGRTHAYAIKTTLLPHLGHGSVYRALSAMHKKGYVTAEWELPADVSSEGGGPPRKYFELSALGREALERMGVRERQARTARAARMGSNGTGRAV